MAIEGITTFITPIGIFWWNRPPLGIASVPEHFQRRMLVILTGVKGINYLHGRCCSDTWEDTRRRQPAAGCCSGWIKLELHWMQRSINFSQNSVGHIVDGTGIIPDPQMGKVIKSMKEPTKARCAPGMTNWLAKYAPGLGTGHAQPLCDILSKWNPRI